MFLLFVFVIFIVICFVGVSVGFGVSFGVGIIITIIFVIISRFCPHLLVNPAKEGEPTADDILEATLR